MELRYTSKVYLFKKALGKTLLTKPEFFMLYTVYLNDGRRLTDITKTMVQAKRSTGFSYQTKYLNQLISKGYITKNEFNYSLTAGGLSILKELERRLRNQRY